MKKLRKTMALFMAVLLCTVSLNCLESPILANAETGSTTETSTETSTEISTETSTETSTEISTQTSTESSAETSTEASSEAGTEASSSYHTGLSTIAIPIEDIVSEDDSAETNEIVVSPESDDLDYMLNYYTTDSSEWTKYSSDYYYDKLSDNQKTVYDALVVKSLEYVESSDDFSSVSALGSTYGDAFTITFDGFTLTSSEIDVVYNAFMGSNAQYYYLSNAYGYSSSSLRILSYSDFNDGTYRTAQSQQFLSELETWSNEVNQESTTYLKEKKANDLLCNNVTYDEDSDLNQSAYSTIVNHTTVCAGYAKAFNLLCSAADIPCIYVTSSAHAWNQVYLGSAWYLVDVTWADDDDYNQIYYDYFNKSETTVLGYNSYSSYYHTPESIWDNLRPTTSSTDYEPSSNELISTPYIATESNGSTKKVTITCDASDATIFYTTDGTTPTTSSTLYTGSFSVSSSSTIMAIAVLDGYTSSVAESSLLEDGVYKIYSGASSSMLIDVAGVDFGDGANVQLWDDLDIASQEFEVEYLDNGYYQITALHSSKSLDVAGMGTTSGTNVWQWDSDVNCSQQWALNDIGNGYYYLKEKNSGLVLGVSGSVTNGSNLVIETKTGTSDEQFSFVQVTSDQQEVLDEGTYVISTELDSSKVLDIAGVGFGDGCNLQLWDNLDIASQHFTLDYLGDGYYQILAEHSGKALDVCAMGTTDGSNVWQWDADINCSQQWRILNLGGGSYVLREKNSGLILDVSGCNSSSGTNVQIWDAYGITSQRFQFTQLTDDDLEVLAEGTYTIGTALTSNMVLDVAAVSQDSGANVQLWENLNINSQRFMLEYYGDGCYQVIAVHSKKALDVSGMGTTDGSNVWQWDSNTNCSQLWRISNLGGGKYQLKDINSGLVLDVSGWGTTNGTNIQIWEAYGAESQMFTFTSVY